jgi:tetratricopeptide (TPR) repeat protein
MFEQFTCKTTTEKDPAIDEAIAHFQEGYRLQSKGELQQAAEFYKKSIETYPTAEAYTFLGWTYSFMGHYDEAILECHMAIRVDPDFGNPYNDIGAYLIEKGQLDEAVEWLEKATKSKRYDSYCFPHLNLGRIWESKCDWFKAMDEYREALRLNPSYTLAANSLKRLQSMLN